MFKFLSRFGVKKKPQAEIDFRADCKLIRTALRKRVPLQIRLKNKQSSPQYSSLLIDLQEQSRTLAFDCLHPLEANANVSIGSQFTVDGNLRGLSFNFQVEVLDIETDTDKGTLFHTSFPDSIYTEQQRAAFRVSVSSIRKIIITIISTQHPPQQSFLRDISATGFQISIVDPKNTRFKHGDPLKCCMIDLPQSEKFMCSAKVQHIQHNDENNITQVGCRFTDVTGGDQRIINRFINNLQRENRRREQGEDFDKAKNEKSNTENLP
ncbi:MAG: hypothetical protein COB04_01535 [Gammaproteobacteria bacterium]|nr:MAG: hypothetical protein COB04_01535 [Gammaproteobacteria bacterium]